jgi:hypothetical protein
MSGTYERSKCLKKLKVTVVLEVNIPEYVKPEGTLAYLMQHMGNHCIVRVKDIKQEL